MVERFARLAEPKEQPLTRPLPSPAYGVNTEQTRRNPGDDQSIDPSAHHRPLPRRGIWPRQTLAEPHFATLAKSPARTRLSNLADRLQQDQALGDAINSASGDLCQNLCGKTNLDEAVTYSPAPAPSSATTPG